LYRIPVEKIVRITNPKTKVPSYPSADDYQPEVRGMGARNVCSALPRGLRLACSARAP
jgi:hypothetical protein